MYIFAKQKFISSILIVLRKEESFKTPMLLKRLGVGGKLMARDEADIRQAKMIGRKWLPVGRFE